MSKKQIEINCVDCGKIFIAKKSNAMRCPQCRADFNKYSSLNRYRKINPPLNLVGECKCCGRKFNLKTKRQIYCSDECKRIYYASKITYKRKEISMPKLRPLTCDTEMLVCMYTSRGESISSIAKDFNRPEFQIKSILERAKRTGRYKLYTGSKAHQIDSSDYYGKKINYDRIC